MNSESVCVVCGCTDSNACEGGCSWKQADSPVCSRCLGKSPYIKFEERGQFRIFPPGAQGAEVPGGPLVFLNPANAEAALAQLNFAFALGRRLGLAEAVSTTADCLILARPIKRPKPKKIGA